MNNERPIAFITFKKATHLGRLAIVPDADNCKAQDGSTCACWSVNCSNVGSAPICFTQGGLVFLKAPKE